jgi:hypothetical protein
MKKPIMAGVAAGFLTVGLSLLTDNMLASLLIGIAAANFAVLIAPNS